MTRNWRSRPQKPRSITLLRSPMGASARGCRYWVYSSSSLILGQYQQTECKHFVTLGSCLLRGILNTYGAYQSYYESGELFTESSSTISWIGSLQSFLLLLVGTLTGPVYDAGYIYHLLWAGSFIITFGQMMLSLCHTFWQALLAQAFCIGIGCGCLFIPGVAILSTYFNTRISLAVGLAASGSSLGTLCSVQLQECTFLTSSQEE